MGVVYLEDCLRGRNFRGTKDEEGLMGMREHHGRHGFTQDNGSYNIAF